MCGGVIRSAGQLARTKRHSVLPSPVIRGVTHMLGLVRVCNPLRPPRLCGGVIYPPRRGGVNVTAGGGRSLNRRRRPLEVTQGSSTPHTPLLKKSSTGTLNRLKLRGRRNLENGQITAEGSRGVILGFFSGSRGTFSFYLHFW